MFNAMLQRRLFRAALGGGSGAHLGINLVFGALFSDDPEDMDEAITYINETPGWPDEFKTELESLRDFREEYAKRAEDMSEEERRLMEKYDDALTMDIVEQLDNCEPEPHLLGDPPPELTPH